MSTGSAVVVHAGEGEDLFFGGGRVTFKVSSSQVSGGFAVMEDRMPKGKTTPLHVHALFDETLYVLEGEILVHVDGEEFVVSTGGLAVAPRGIPHAFLVTSDEARLLAFATPGDMFERFIREGGDVANSPDAEPPPLDIAKVKGAGESTGGMQVLGPPPFDLAHVG
jgi:quercetin dioxygenase-like cupin family protein